MLDSRSSVRQDDGYASDLPADLLRLYSLLSIAGDYEMTKKEAEVVELLPNGLTKVELPKQTEENKEAWRNLFSRFREIAREAEEHTKARRS